MQGIIVATAPTLNGRKEMRIGENQIYLARDQASPLLDALGASAIAMPDEMGDAVVQVFAPGYVGHWVWCNKTNLLKYNEGFTCDTMGYADPHENGIDCGWWWERVHPDIFGSTTGRYDLMRTGETQCIVHDPLIMRHARGHYVNLTISSLIVKRDERNAPLITVGATYLAEPTISRSADSK